MSERIKAGLRGGVIFGVATGAGAATGGGDIGSAAIKAVGAAIVGFIAYLLFPKYWAGKDIARVRQEHGVGDIQGNTTPVIRRNYWVPLLIAAALAAGAWLMSTSGSYDDCILQNMSKVQTQVAALSIRAACRSKFPSLEGKHEQPLADEQSLGKKPQQRKVDTPRDEQEKKPETFVDPWAASPPPQDAISALFQSDKSGTPPPNK